jgi:plasmid maintenance system antidote protein VapI
VVYHTVALEKDAIPMARDKARETLTEMLRAALREAPSIRSVATATGVANPVLVRFANGQRGLTLTTAEKLFEHLGIECVRRKRREARRERR